jgi:predicted metal-dependent peptidase
MPHVKPKPNLKLAQARTQACRKWPHATAAILSLVPVEVKGLGTLAVDAHWRLYYDPDFVKKCSAEELMGVICHEVMHLLGKHPERSANYPMEHKGGGGLLNIAQDCSINDILRGEGIKLTQGAIYPETFKLPRNRAWEQHYRDLVNQAKQQQQEQARAQTGSPPSGQQQPGQQPPAGGSDPQAPGGQSPASQPGQGAGPPEAGANGDPDGSPSGGSPGTGGADGSDWNGPPVAPGTSGSCSDGVPRPWEAPAPSGDDEADEQAGVPQGIPKHVQEQILRDVAEKIKSQGRGTSGVWAGFVKDILEPKIDPRALLMRAVRKAIQYTTGGSEEWTYRRPSRRPLPGGLLRPSPVTPVPRITVVVDSSGSMGERDLALALGLIGKVLSGLRLRDGVHVIVGDECPHTSGIVSDPKRVAVVGRGGTSMRRLIEHAAEQKPTPDVILVATDGETDWPNQPVKPSVVACLTRQDCYQPPAWIKTVVLNP